MIHQILKKIGQRNDFLPENTLVYCNQGTISTLKSGEYPLYLDHVIVGQVIAAKILHPILITMS